MVTGTSVIRKSGVSRSNLELINSLRDNLAAAQEDFAVQEVNTNGFAHPARRPKAPFESWTEQEGKTLFVPRVDWTNAGLRDDADQYEITVKLFLLSGTPVAERRQYILDALTLVSKELGVPTIDLLILSFPGLSFEGTCEMKADRNNAQQGNLDEEIATWTFVEELYHRGVVKRLGVAEFGSQKLGAFLKRAAVRPAIDQINLKDCCSVPLPLKRLADAEDVELHVHSDCTDILPKGTLRELLGHGPDGAGVLAHATNGAGGFEDEILPQWVVRYTAFVKDRGVIENKGYFAGAILERG